MEIKVKMVRIDKMKNDFSQISNKVFRILKGEPSAYMVYSYLNFRYNKENDYAFPSFNRIARDLGLSRNTIIKSINILENKKLIKVLRKRLDPEKNDVNKYIVYFPYEINVLTEEEIKYAPESDVVTISVNP